MPYSKALQVIEANNKIYCLTDGGIFYYNKLDNSINKLTKVSGLSDVGMSTIQYNEQYKLLLIGYSNGNIDIITNNEIINISDVKRKQITGNKSINSILFIGKKAYLSCGFGIIVVDIEKREIKDTYYIGDNGSQIFVNEIAFDGTYLYAATKKGIYKGDINSPSLENYMNWNKITDIPNCNSTFNTIVYYDNKIITNFYSNQWNKDTLYKYENNQWTKFDTSGDKSNNLKLISYKNRLYVIKIGYLFIISEVNRNVLYAYINNSSNPNYAITDKDGQVWIADNDYGLIRYTGFESQSIYPTSPGSKNVVSMSIVDDKLCVVPGGKDVTWNNLWAKGALYEFNEESWKKYNYMNISQLDTLNDFACIAINPNNSNQVFIGSWGRGVIEFNNGQITNIFDYNNSTLQTIIPSKPYVRIGGIAFDSDGNLWVTNCGVDNVISVRKSDGTWIGLDYRNEITGANMGDIIVTKNNNKWALIRDKGLFVFNNGASLDNVNDDERKKIDVIDENGAIISNSVFSIAEDLNGEIWVGTNMGVVVYYNPNDVFSNNFYAQRIKVPSNISGQANYMLETETITCIAVDGANRKWLGTANAGVFLMSEDGTSQILNFNIENSPLLSNEITSIVINNNTGEVFIGTTQGLVSYKGTATKGQEDYESLYVYPNPVKQNYTGLITIKGLIASSNVKVTDINGNIVFETIAEGGQAIWNGRTFSGDKVHSGVYLVFCTNTDGSMSHVTKLLVIN